FCAPPTRRRVRQVGRRIQCDRGMPRSPAHPVNSAVAVVLAGGGARGAYEIGALSALLPRLQQRGERPQVFVGTSVGAINAAFLASTAADPLDSVLANGSRLWSEIGFDDVLRPLLSPAELARAVGSLGEFLRLPGAHLWSLLDPSPLARTLRSRSGWGASTPPSLAAPSKPPPWSPPPGTAAAASC